MEIVTGVLLNVALVCVIAVIVLPTGWYTRLDPDEQEVVRWFLIGRALMPLVVLVVVRSSLISGGWDAERYHVTAIEVRAQLVQSGVATAQGRVPGTGAVDLLLGQWYRITGVTNQLLAAYAWTAIASLGILLLWWSTRHLVENRRRYALVALFVPTLFFWSANLGKEPLLILGLGLAMSGVHFLTVEIRFARAFASLAGGVALMGYVRPHIALLFFASLVIGSLLASSRLTSTSTRARRGLILVVGLVAVVAAAPLTSQLLAADQGSSVVDAAYQSAEARSGGQGNSSFEREPTRSPAAVPGAVATVMLRPYPWEVRSAAQAAASLESLVFFVLLVRGVRGIAAGTHRLERSVQSMTSILYILLFSSAIASYGNFGLIVRQRMQVWSFLVLLVFAIRPVVRDDDVVDEQLITRGVPHG